MKTFSLGTALAVLAGKPWRATVLASCIPTPGPLTATFKIRLSDYPFLTQPMSSVRLGVNPVRQEEEPFPDGDFWPLLINRGPNMEIYVLDSECRHASCVVPAYDDFFFGIRCPCHGSTYDIDGRILSGPSEQSLRRYAFEFDGDDTLTIHIPKMGFAVCAEVVKSGPKNRVALTFDTHLSVSYEVSYRQHIQDPWSVVPFSNTANGPANQSVLSAIGLTETVYVEPPASTGFYAVSMVLSEV